MNRNYFRYIFLTFLVSILSTASAAAIDTLPYWEAEPTTGYVYYLPAASDGYVYWGIEYTSGDLTFSQAMYSATSQAAGNWQDAMSFQIPQYLSSPDICSRYGAATQIYDLYGYVVPYDNFAYPDGITPIGELGASTDVRAVYGSIYLDVTIRPFVEDKFIYIVRNNNISTTRCYAVVAHEMGHALGWCGHASNSTKLMYNPVSSAVTVPTTTDVRHILQVYNYIYPQLS